MIKIGLLGCGTVGTGVLKLLTSKKEEFKNRINNDYSVKSVAVKNLDKKRDTFTESINFTSNPEEIINDPEIDIIVELVGGSEPARTYIINSIKNGKHVVTANKEVIAKYGNEIYELAEKHNVLIFIEGSVAGGIPIIQTLKRDLIANKIKTLMGIINGTTNYILSEMTQNKSDFSEVLQKAQNLGYAESIATSDIEGFDAVYKLSIISSLIFGGNVNIDNIYREGITKVSIKDIEFADKLGFVIKLLAIAKQNENGDLETRVHPTMLPKEHPLASVNDAFNAIWMYGDSVGEFMLYGRGAGQLPTASAVVADILNLSIEMKLKNPVATFIKDDLKVTSMNNLTSQYYLRLSAEDRPGIIGIIGRDLGESEISISSLWQADSDGKTAEIVLVTHAVKEENMNKAIKLLKESEGIKEINSIIRVEEETIN